MLLYVDGSPERMALAYKRLSEDKRNNAIWAQTVEEAISVLEEYSERVTEVSLEHDLNENVTKARKLGMRAYKMRAYKVKPLGITPGVLKLAKKPKKKSTDELKSALAQKEHWRKKAEIAETKIVEAKEEKDVPKKSDLSQEDLLSLVEVHKDDRSEVMDYAKFKNISVEEALKSDVIKTTLREKAEERKTADATNTGKSTRGSSKVSGESLLKKAEETGEMPESDADLDKMLDADLDKRQKEAKSA